MITTHRLHVGDARRLDAVAPGSAHLVVTSPPYPMIAMWDEAFAAMDPGIGPLLERDGAAAFERMHRCLDEAWARCHRALCPGGLCCVNVGDATRSLGGEFRLYPNHARIVAGMMALGFTVLPDILWHKPTNAPNKFMGSGMLPAGAYVTYEHEYVLIFRKGGKRTFETAAERQRRARSAYFWEERNTWFTDVWTGLPGARQGAGARAERARSAAFPLELAFRLVAMHSLLGDLVLDPFAGRGTTLAAAALLGRSSAGVEIAEGFAAQVGAALAELVAAGPGLVRARLDAHRAFVGARQAAGKPPRHHNAGLDVPVVTAQEEALELWVPVALGDLGAGCGVPAEADPGAQLRLWVPTPSAGPWEVEHAPLGPP